MDVLRRAGIVEMLEEEAFYQNVVDAVHAATEVEERPAHDARDEIRADVAGQQEADKKGEAAGGEL